MQKAKHLLLYISSLALCLSLLMGPGAYAVFAGEEDSSEDTSQSSEMEDSFETGEEQENASPGTEPQENEDSSIGEEGKDGKDMEGMDMPQPEEVQPEADEKAPADIAPEAEGDLVELDASTAVVYNYTGLTEALSQNNGYTYIYFGDDIIGENAGIEVHTAKGDFVIDGTNPYTGQQHTYRQFSSGEINRTIYITGAAHTTKNATLRSMTIEGANHYGPIYVGPAVIGATIVYEDITYNGPQITHNVSGGAVYNNCRIEILRRHNDPNEVAEANAITFIGENNIQVAAGAGNVVFWMYPTNPTFTLEPGANVTIISPSNDMFYTTGLTDVVFGEGSALTFTGRRFFRDAGHRIKSLCLAESSALTITETGSDDTPTLYIDNQLTLQQGSSLYIYRSGGGASPIRMLNAGASIVFNNPERVVLYTPTATARIMRFASTGTLTMTMQALNRWQTTPSGLDDDIYNEPLYRWNNYGLGAFTVNATFSGDTMQTFSTTLEADNPSNGELTAATFTTNNTGLLVLGAVILGIDPITSGSATISGNAAPAAQLQASYTVPDDGVTVDGSATGEGTYSLPITGQPVVGTNVYVLVHHNLLKAVDRTPVLDWGDYTLSFQLVPEALEFQTTLIQDEPWAVYRQQQDWELVVLDNRLTPAGWNIQASILEPLTAQLGENSFSLPQALVYVDENNNQIPLSSEPMRIYTQTNPESGAITVSWPEQEGILLWVNPSEVRSEALYTATINWTLVDAP